MDTMKSVHTLVLDAGPIIKNEPPISSLLKESEALVTIPSVISETRDESARLRIQTTLLPFLTFRSPKPESVRIITEFARRTGDVNVLSETDRQLLALSYELECERNGGDWRLRKIPGQKTLNGSPPKKQDLLEESSLPDASVPTQDEETINGNEAGVIHSDSNCEGEVTSQGLSTQEELRSDSPAQNEDINQIMDATHLTAPVGSPLDAPALPEESEEVVKSEDSDSDGWITPSNFKHHQAKDLDSSMTPSKQPKTMQVATITTDFAMQNVLLQMNLNLLSPSLQRVRLLKTYILRCHACFEKCKDMSKHFCPRCGKPTLTRVACSTNQNGEFKLHLKKNMQWNTRGDRFSIPKPVSGSANGKVNTSKGGGKGGWGQELVLAEDQKEYLQAMQGQSRRKERDLMDQEYLPGILTGERGRAGGRVKIGAGRNVNSKKR
ncbi:MAG: Nin1 binding protein [Pycnora praestabilis]|nr:MAG: Nin1 binding protein [Pycnora praestabilis]